jgi:hypothetical protein
MKDLGITINHIFRYGYAGFLSVLIAVIINPDETKEIVEALGNVLSPIVAFAVGGAIYALYRAVIGDSLLFPLADKWHRNWHPWPCHPAPDNCKFHFLQKGFNIVFSDRWIAFGAIRDGLFETERARRFEEQHSEVHLIYITFTVAAVVTAYLLINQFSMQRTWIFFAFTWLCLFSGIYADILVCRRECAYLRKLSAEKYKEINEILLRANLKR